MEQIHFLKNVHRLLYIILFLMKTKCLYKTKLQTLYVKRILEYQTKKVPKILVNIQLFCYLFLVKTKTNSIITNFKRTQTQKKPKLIDIAVLLLETHEKRGGLERSMFLQNLLY